MNSPLTLDTMFEVIVPDGVSEQGRTDIMELVARWKLTFPEDWEWKWANKEGNLTKRLEKLARAQKVIIPSGMVAKVGEIAQEHSLEPTTYNIRVTRNLMWSDGDFGDYGSCFWGGRSSNRDLLIHNNAYAIQFFNSDQIAMGGKKGLGRAFGYELDDGMQIIFNSYGNLRGLPINPSADTVRKDAQLVKVAQIFSLLLKGNSYKRVSLINNGGELFINSDVGFVIGPWSTIRRVSQIDLGLVNPKAIPCSICGNMFDHPEKHLLPVHAEDGEETLVCLNCFKLKYYKCALCGSNHLVNEAKRYEGNRCCKECFVKNARMCSMCGEGYRISHMVYRQSDKKWLCRDDWMRSTLTCVVCHEQVNSGELSVSGKCSTCQKDKTAPKVVAAR